MASYSEVRRLIRDVEEQLDRGGYIPQAARRVRLGEYMEGWWRPYPGASPRTGLELENPPSPDKGETSSRKG